MSWNYRIVKHRERDGATWYAIQAVNYHEKPDASTPKSWTEPVINTTEGEPVAGLLFIIAGILMAWAQPVLVYDDETETLKEQSCEPV